MKTPYEIAMEAKYGFGDRVFFFNNAERRGVIIGILLFPGELKYEVQWSDCAHSIHYGFEITDEKPALEDVLTPNNGGNP